MKIAIDLTPLYGRKHTGVEMYAIDLYRALLSLNHEIIPIFHVENELDDNPRAVVIPKRNRLWLENISLKLAVKKVDADIVLFPIFPPPYDVYGGKSKIIPVLHDFAFLKFRKTLNTAAKYYLTPKMLRSFKMADGIITISETIKTMAADYTNLPVYNCCENVSLDYKNCQSKVCIDYLKKWNLAPEEYVISVSTIEPRKNFKYLMKVVFPYIEKNRKKLVLVGRRGWGNDSELKSLIEFYGDKVVFTDFVDFNELISLYHFADFFALLSLDEGFGRTPFEAVASGCRRIVLSDIPIFRETFGMNGFFLPLNDVDACKNILLSEKIPSVSENFVVPFDVMDQKICELMNFFETQYS